MKKNVQGIICLLLGLTLVPLAWSGEKIREGTWELSIVRDMMGDGPESTPRKFSSCLKKGRWSPADPAEPKGCEHVDPQVEDDQVVYTRICREKSGTVIETRVEMVFYGTTMDGYLHTVIDDPETGVSELTEYMKGEFKGPCPAAQ